jgi:hypothetical protein
MELTAIKSEIETILNKTLPNIAYRNVWVGKHFDNTNYIGIKIGASDIEINRVKGQNPQLVSLLLDIDTMELNIQMFGCNGGQNIYIKPTEGINLYMQRIKIPFRKPKGEIKFIYSAIEKFAFNWLNALKENKDMLMYKDLVNYVELLK